MASNGKIKAKSKNSNRSIKSFFVDLKAEFKRFTWPTKEETKRSTIAVLGFCAVFVVIAGLLDKGFASLFNLIFFK